MNKDFEIQGPTTETLVLLADDIETQNADCGILNFKFYILDFEFYNLTHRTS